MESQSNIVLDNGLELSKITTTGSILQINQEYEDTDTKIEKTEVSIDFIGKPVLSFEALEKNLVAIDNNGFVKKEILTEGGGFPLHEGCTVFIAFSAYWENDSEPFDVRTVTCPMEVNLKDHGLLPGLEMAIKSMLVGEKSVFLLSYKVMYGEMGIPPRIKPKSDCVFFIQLTKSILTPKEGKIQYSEPNMFNRVHNEVKMLYSSGTTLYKSNNYSAAVQIFNKAVNMLHKCRLADEAEESEQEKMLIKLYINLAICYNKNRQPLKACVACNELNRLSSLWNNGKVLYQNAKALKMIGSYKEAERRLQMAMKLGPNNKELEIEMDSLIKTREASEMTKSLAKKTIGCARDVINEQFKQEVENVIREFKNNKEETQLILPAGLNSDETKYLKSVCIRENLFFNKMDKDNFLKLSGQNKSNETKTDKSFDEDLVLHKQECSVIQDYKNSELSAEVNNMQYID